MVAVSSVGGGRGGGVMLAIQRGKIRSGTQQYSFGSNAFFGRRVPSHCVICNVDLHPNFAFDFGYPGDLTS